ncbi:hypothetical protein C8F01DRAFT_1294410 [Mycena amicta]|nr:hypothetical protein C8F01DRAFT_1294410 [Mycena amicta]
MSSRRRRDDSGDDSYANPVQPTATEKRRLTRQANEAQQRAQDRALIESTAGHSRESKKTALKNKVWEEDAPHRERKRSASTVQEPEKPKKPRTQKPAGLAVLLAAPHDKRKQPPRQRAPAPIENPLQVRKPKPLANESTSSKPVAKGRYAAAALKSDSEEDREPAPPKKASASTKSKGKGRAQDDSNSGGEQISGEGDVYGEHSDDSHSASGEEDLAVAAEEIDRLERPKLIQHPRPLRQFSAVPETEDIRQPELTIADLDEEMSDAAPPRRRRNSEDDLLKFHGRSSSHASSTRESEWDLPADTDPEDLFGNELFGNESEDGEKRHRKVRAEYEADDADDLSEGDVSAEDIVKPVRPKASSRKSAQQLKYDAEVGDPLLLRGSNHRFCRLRRSSNGGKLLGNLRNSPARQALATSGNGASIFVSLPPPAGVGELRLNDQSVEIQRLIRKTIELACVDVAFDCAYPTISDRGVFMAVFLYKSDDMFCRLLADLIMVRTSILRNKVKSAITGKVPDYLHLTKEGIRAVQAHDRVKLCLKDQSYIFPIVELPPTTADPEEAVVPTLPPVKFKTDMPFHAKPIVEVLREVFFNKGGVGRKNSDQLQSYNKKYPEELELPPVMLALVATHFCGTLHMWATGRKFCGTLHMWATGRKVETSDFSQEALETTYTGPIDFIDDTRTTNPDGWHRTMHALYKSVTKSAEATAIVNLGSARNIVTLAPEPADAD